MNNHLSAIDRCRICGNHLDAEDQFCSNCGTEAPLDNTENANSKNSLPKQTASVYSFRCNDCGAAMSYDASAQSLRCPFCGSLSMTRKPDTRVLRPEGIVPFLVPHEAAVKLCQDWIHEGFWRPSDIRERSMIEAIAAVYVPYWVFSAATETHWTADSSAVPAGSRGNWCPVAGDHRNQYTGLLVGGSTALTPAETSNIAPFDLNKAVLPEEIDLTNVRVEEFQMPRKQARPLAVGSLQELERQACRKYVRGESRNLRVNVRISNMSSHPILLPIWIMAYRYKNQVYRVLINGQTGKLSGGAPFAYGKLAAIITTIVIVVLLIALAVFFMSRIR